MWLPDSGKMLRTIGRRRTGSGNCLRAAILHWPVDGPLNSGWSFASWCRRGHDFMRVDFKSNHLPWPYGDAFLYPVGPIVDPPRRGSSDIEAAELLNGLRMNGYREHCEKLKHSEMHGTPAQYLTQIPWLGSPRGRSNSGETAEAVKSSHADVLHPTEVGC